MTELGLSADKVAACRTADAALTLMRLSRMLERVDSGLTSQQYRILKMAGAGGERSARLAERLAVAKPTLTATADGLVAAGLAHRSAEPGDRRVVRLCLTRAGAAALDRADAAYAGWLAQLLDAAGEPDRILRDLDLLNSALDELRRARLTAPARRHGTPGAAPAGVPVSRESTPATAESARPTRQPNAQGTAAQGAE